MQYLPLLSPERVDGIVSVAGCPASAKELPEELIVDWVARAGDREKLREIPMMFAVKPDLTLVDEWADDGDVPRNVEKGGAALLALSL